MVKILFDFSKLSDTDFNMRLAYIFKKMNNNAIYAMLQSLITVLGVTSGDFDTALINAEERGSTVIKIKNKLRAEALVFLKKFIGKIESVANDMPEEAGFAFAKGTGFTVQEAITKVTLTFLEIPFGFSATDDKQRRGWCILDWKKVVGALVYVIEELDDKGNIKNTYTSTKTTLNLPGTESNVVRIFRVRASGVGSLCSDNSATASVFVS